LLSLLRVFHFSRQLTALSGLPLAFRDFLHGGPPTVLKVYQNGAPENTNKQISPPPYLAQLFM
jgi:hypothetical protein